MASLSIQRINISWKSCYQSFPLSGCYFRYHIFVKRKPGDQLNVIVDHIPLLFNSANAYFCA